MTLLIKQVDDLASVARGILSRLKPNKERATILAMEGDLGAGKTTLTQYLALVLGIKDRITSPTFVLRRMYFVPKNMAKDTGWEKIIHYDWYRLSESRDLETMDWVSDIKEPKTLIVVEWPKQIPVKWPKETKKISFKHLANGSRRLTISWW